jgi:hypothetical protein
VAIKKRFVECECGELFTENAKNQLEGNTICGPWKLKDSRRRNTKTDSGSDILIAMFERPVGCAKCKQELMREKRQYELTPPDKQTDDPVSVYASREFIVRSPQAVAKPQANGVVTDETAAAVAGVLATRNGHPSHKVFYQSDEITTPT